MSCIKQIWVCFIFTAASTKIYAIVLDPWFILGVGANYDLMPYSLWVLPFFAEGWAARRIIFKHLGHLQILNSVLKKFKACLLQKTHLIWLPLNETKLQRKLCKSWCLLQNITHMALFSQGAWIQNMTHGFLTTKNYKYQQALNNLHGDNKFLLYFISWLWCLS